MSSNTLVCFDLGGVLIDVIHNWQQIIQTLGIASNLDMTAKTPLGEFEPFIRYQDGAIDEVQYGQELAVCLGVTPDQAIKAHNAILGKEFEGTPQLIADLKQTTVKTCCLSNTNALHWEILTSPSHCPSIASLDDHYASHLLKVSKPDEAIFHAVQERYHHDTKVVFFDDSFPNIQAALAFGWIAFHVDSSNPTPQIRASLQEIGIL